MRQSVLIGHLLECGGQVTGGYYADPGLKDVPNLGGLVTKDTCKDQVRVTGATSHGIPETLKVSIGYRDCFIGEDEISYGGSNCINRAKLAGDIYV